MELVNPESPETKEMVKWEQFPSKWTLGAAPGNPYQYRPFPAMVYRAHQIPAPHLGAGKLAVSLGEPEFYGFRDQQEWERARESAARFTTSCQRIVNDEAELSRAMEDGWRPTPGEALAHAEARANVISHETHKRQSADSAMSEGARAEAEQFERENFGHQPEIPTAAARKRRKGSA